MTRLAWTTTIYAIVAAVALSAPLAASEEPVPEAPAEEPAASTEPAPGPPAQAAPEAPPAPESPPVAPPAPPAPPPEPAPEAEPAPAPAPAEPEPQEIRDEAPVERPKATAAASTTVTIRDFQFAPASVTIDVGDTVTWTNQGPTPHSATAEDGSFDTGIYDAGESRSHTFDAAGTFSYICTPHPQMRGTVTVQAASSGGGQDSGDDAGTDTDADATAGEAGADADDGPALPATGLDAGGVAVLGLMTLALGAWLRRRAAAAGQAH